VAWWHYALFMLGFFVLAGVVSYWVPEPENDFMRILRSSRTAVVLVAIMATFTAPLVEEVIYRGVLYSAFQRTFGAGFAVVVVTILFAAVHVPQYYPSVATMFLLTLLSLTLTLIRARSGNLLPCIVLHTIFNGAQSILLLVDPSLEKAKDAVPAIFLLFR
jgi:membrane protease YdiL (CAAX protease family)